MMWQLVSVAARGIQLTLLPVQTQNKLYCKKIKLNLNLLLVYFFCSQLNVVGI